jgi:carboxypeptidase Taq
MIQESALAELTALVKRVATLESIGQLLGWDEQVNLPPGAAEQRAAQQALLAETMQAAGAAPRIGELLTQLETRAAELDAGARAIVAQARRDYDRATRLPPEFVREKAAQDSRGFHVWAKARAASDFPAFAPVLEKNLEFAQREAAYLGW